MEAVVTLEKLTKHFAERGGGGRRARVLRAVEEVSLAIAPGETLGLVGESGCGKSTLGRTALRLHEPSGGRIFIDGVEVTALEQGPLRAFRKRAQMIFQDPFASLNPRMTVAQILEEPLQIHRLAGGRDGRRRRVGELLERVGLRPEAARRYPHEFSGGQRQRLGIARALAVEPRFIVADEPLSALDVSIQAQIVNLLVGLQVEARLTYLFISHDLKVVAHLCDRVAVMYLGRIVEEAEAGALCRAPAHPYSRALYSAVPRIGPAKEGAARPPRILLEGELPSPSAPPPGCAFHPRCPLYAKKGRPEICARSRPELIERPPGSDRRVACHFAGES